MKHGAGRALVLAFVASALVGACGSRAPSPAVPFEFEDSSSAPVATAPTVQTDARPASPSELALVKRLMRETERLRGLPFLRPVDVTIEGPRAMRAYVERAIDDQALQRATRRYLALGVIDPEIDVRALLVAVMEEELVGYYDPKQKRLAVRADIARALDHEASSARGLVWRATVVHELVHALQDQHFDLGAKISQERTTDADDAWGALVEGDATLVMLGYTAELSGESIETIVQQPERILAALTRPPEQLTSALRKAPALLREPLLFRYREGARFCARLVRTGGWARVDAAHRKPPDSTRAIRKPDAFLGGEDPLEIALPAVVFAGWTERDRDVLGALEVGVLLGLDAPSTARVIDAWRGDRYLVLEREGALGSFWSLEFATKAVAREVAQALRRARDPARLIAQDERRVIVGRGLDADAFADAVERVRRASVATHSGGPLATSAARH